MEEELFWGYGIHICNHRVIDKVSFLFFWSFFWKEMEYIVHERGSAIRLGNELVLFGEHQQMWRIGNLEKEWFVPITFINHGTCPTEREQQPTQSLTQGLLSPAWHLMVAIDWVKYQLLTRLISHNSQDLRVSARGLPVHMERLLLEKERLWGLPLQLAVSVMIIRGLEWFSHGEQQAVISLLLFICPSLHWMLLAGSEGLKGTAGREQ